MAKTSPTKRTLDLLRKKPVNLVQVVERWNPFAGKRVDLFGIIDVLAIVADGENEPHITTAVQCTSYSNVSARVNKIKESPAYSILKKANWRIVVWGWYKKKGSWCVREVEL